MRTTNYFAVLAVLCPCGGTGWLGATTCVAGRTCVEHSEDYSYSQCIPDAQVPTTRSFPTSIPTISYPTAPGSTPTSIQGLNDAALAAGKLYLGTATDNSELTDAAYTAILNNIHQFGQITPEKSMNWAATEPERGVFTFENGDVIANLAKTNGQLLRGFSAVWYDQLPSWVISGNYDAADLTDIIETHTSTIVRHYKGQIWDVINEPLNDDGTFRTDIFYNTLGTSYILVALQAARSADPNAKLFINEYNIESAGAKSTALQKLVKQLIAEGVPIDGVGIEGHFIVGEVPSEQELISNWEAFTALGVEISINELDIRMSLPETTALLEQQSRDYETVVSACVAVEKCVGITLWDFTDKYSWVPSTFPGQGYACPWSGSLQVKAAYYCILAGFGY